MEKDYNIEEKNINDFLMIFGGHVYFQTLYAAIKFDLFTILEEHGSMSLEDIFVKLDIDKQPARILLLGLVSIKLLEKKDDQYVNTPLSKSLLNRHSNKNIIKIIEWEHEIVYQGMFHFYDSLKSNKNLGLNVFDGNEPTLYERLAYVPEKKQIFQDAMHKISVQANADLVEHVDFSDISYLVDIGGGDGSNIMQIAEAFPQIKGAVFDLPTVCPIAESKIKDSGFENRIDVIQGDCFENDFPKKADCFLFAHFMTIWSEEKDRLLFQKAYDALPKGGKVMIFNQMQHDDGTGPLIAALGSPYFLSIATGEGMLYTWQEYKDWIKEAGFSNIQTYKLPRAHGVIVGEKT